MVLSVALSNLTLQAANLSCMLLRASYGRAPIFRDTFSRRSLTQPGIRAIGHMACPLSYSHRRYIWAFTPSGLACAFLISSLFLYGASATLEHEVLPFPHPFNFPAG